MIKRFFNRLRHWKSYRECEKRADKLIWKFQNDVWENIFFLNNGYWFIANELINIDHDFGQTWLEFRCDCDQESIYSHGLNAKFNLTNFKGRRFVVNAAHIVSVTEFDS